MALRQAGLNRTVMGASSLTLSPSQSSLLVKGIYCAPASGQYIRVRIGSMTMRDVGFFRNDSATLGSQVAYYNAVPIATRGIKFNLLDFLYERGIFKGYPVAKGEQFVITPSAGTLTCTVVFDEYDADDIKSTHPNGSTSNEHLVVIYGDAGSVINSTGVHGLTRHRMPGDWGLAWPFTPITLPTKIEAEVYGITASSRAADDNSATANFIRTRYLLLRRDQNVLFDVDGRGFLMWGHTPIGTVGGFECGIGPHTGGEASHLNPLPPLMFSHPLIFKEGEDLNLFWDVETAATPGSFTLAEQEVGVIVKFKKIA